MGYGYLPGEAWSVRNHLEGIYNYFALYIGFICFKL
jgi:hypothetical protein